MAKRRRKQQNQMDAARLAVIVIFLAAIAGAGSVIAKVLGSIIVVIGVAVFALLLAVAWDVAAWAAARASGENRPFVATATLVSVLLTPYRLWRRLVEVFHPPLRVATIGELLMLTPTQFEEAIAQTLRDNGYTRVERKGGAGDLGVDITCRDPNGETLAVQCKRYAPGKLVGSRELQLFIGMTTTHHPVDRGVYVTTSGYTQPARKLAEQHGIRLIDGHQLARIIGPAGLTESQPAAGALG
jgi:restriction system protein